MTDVFSLNVEALNELRGVWQKGKLTIVVGSGASKQSGLPTWYEVLDKLILTYVENKYKDTMVEPITKNIRDCLMDRLRKESPIVIAHNLQSNLKQDEYIGRVHSALYGELKAPPIPGPITQAIASLGSKLNSVVTFNFDGLVETALLNDGTVNTPVWLPDHWAKVDGLPVYHPHGYLPYEMIEKEPYWIVLAESDYHTQFASTHNWSNVAISRALLETTCLFVSTSITDPNLRRILDLMHRENPTKYHYFMWSKPDDDDFENPVDAIAHKAYEEIFVESHRRLGLKPFWFHYKGDDPSGIDKNYNWNDIPELLKAIKRI